MKKYCIINSLLIVFFSIFIGSCVENIVNLDEDDVKDIPQDIVSPYYVPIDWDSTELIENDSVSGKVILSLTPQTEMISEGSVISIIDPLNPGIKIITKAIRNGETIQLETIKGDLTNIFANVEFTLDYSPESKIHDGRSQITAQPKAIGEEIEGGRYVWKTIITTPKPKSMSIFDIDGYEIPLGDDSFTVKFSELNSIINMNYRISFNFGMRKEHIIEDVKGIVKMYKNQQIKAALHSAFNLELNMVLEGEGKYEKHMEIEDFVPVFKGKPLKTLKIHLLFDIAGVPIPVVINIKPLAGGVYDFKGSAGFEGIARMNNYFIFDALWDMSKENPYTMMPQFTGPTLDVKGSNFHCNGNADLKIWFYPSTSFYVYDILGPVLDIKPYIRIISNIGGHVTGFDYTNDYQGFKLDERFGMDARADISSRIMGLGNENGRWFDTKFNNIFEKNLFSLPTKIEFASATPNKVEAGRAMVVNFDVKWSILDKWDQPIPSNISIPVKFIGNGSIDKVISYTENGTAHVIWTPSSDDDVLCAVLYDGNGKVIDSEYFNGEKKDEDKHLVQIGDIVKMEYDVLGRIISYQDTENDVKFSYNNDGLYAITLMDGTDPVILSDFVFTQEGYLLSFTNKGDGIEGDCKISYNEDLQPISMTMHDSDGFSATINWRWELGKIKEMLYKNNEGLKEVIKYQYADSFPQMNPLKQWSWCTSSGTMSFLNFSKLMGLGSEMIPTGIVYTTNEYGQSVSMTMKLACGFDGYNIRKEVVAIENLDPIEIEYVYSSPMDITNISDFKIQQNRFGKYFRAPFFRNMK